MSDIFISYARQDRPRAEAIAKALEDHGWSVWWDWNIPAGETSRQVIQEQHLRPRASPALFAIIVRANVRPAAQVGVPVSEWRVTQDLTASGRHQFLEPG
jgi:hypothetical protein